MSPQSRGRKGAKKRKRSNENKAPQLHVVPEPVDEPDAEQMLGDALAFCLEIAGADDPLGAEAVGAALLATGRMAGDDVTQALVESIVPRLEAAASRESLVMLLGMGAVAEEPARSAARSAAHRLVSSGVTEPSWVDELNEPVVPGECYELTDKSGAGSVLACSFRRGDRTHALILTVDHLDCGAADQVDVIEDDDLAATLETLVADSAAEGHVLQQHTVEPADFRWKVECAMDARDVHETEDAELGDLGFDVDDDVMPELEDLLDEDDAPGYQLVAPLVCARMATLPESGKPKPPHPDEQRGGIPPMLARMLTGLTADFSNAGLATADLPPERKESDGPAPVYQIKVGLRGAKPPIWRRLEIPADTSLEALHAVIQAAFGWNGGHLHAFQTPYGHFGVPDSELGHQAEAPVTLEQVAPAEGAKIRYLYDFGDDWDHEIFVEKRLDRRADLMYPRCTGGKRAAPPEDCGGIWGYQELLDVLADPRHPEHEDRLEWLGIDSPEALDPAAFDKHEITESLPRLH